MKTTYKALFIVALVLLAACGEGRWHTHEAWARPTAAGGNAAVYFLLHNATSHDDALLGASSEVAIAVELHHSHLIEAGAGEADHSGDEHTGETHPMSELEAQDLASVGSMQPVERIDIAAGHEIQLQPGGYHIMLIGLTKELQVGDHFVVTLHFEHSEDLEIEVHVLAP